MRIDCPTIVYASGASRVDNERKEADEVPWLIFSVKLQLPMLRIGWSVADFDAAPCEYS